MSEDNVYVLYTKFWKITKISFFFLLTSNRKKFVVSAFLFFLIYGYISLKALNDFDDFSSRTQNSITVLLDRIVILANTAILMVVITSLCKHEAKVKRLQFLINDFDVCLKKYSDVIFNTKNKSQRAFNTLMFIFSITNMYYIGKTIFLCIYLEKVKWILVIQVIYKYVITLTLTKNSIFNSFVYWRFRFLNKYIKSLYKAPALRVSTINNKFSYIDWKDKEYQLSVDTKLKTVKCIQNSITLSKILHNQLRDIVDIFNDSTGRFYTRLLFIVIVEQLKCLLHIFIVLRKYYQHEEMHAFTWFFSFSDLCFGYLSQFSLMLYVANHLQVEVSIIILQVELNYVPMIFYGL